ncbi:Endopolygalacturonase [Hortaea werneckii]|nr:Endopolygalacturonase [Hortaea werneckii]
MHQPTLTSLLLGAGAGMVAAHPAPWSWTPRGHRHHDQPGYFPLSSKPSGVPAGFGSTDGTAVPTGGFGSYIVPSGSGIAAPTLKGYASSSGSGIALPTGTASYAIGTASTTVASTTAVSSGVPSTPTTGASAGMVSKVQADPGCTFTEADAAASGKADCKNIVLKDIAVPAGTTLDMTDLNDGTTVTFEGTTTFGYEEWKGPLISFSGTDITVQGADGHLIDMGGDQWWDGKGSNGGVTKPKGFYAHSLTESVITGLNIKNTPIQCFSINGAENLHVVDITIDNSEAKGEIEDGGHNTDAFDVGSSTGVYISGANVKNQDDCLAINSGTDISFTGATCSGGHGISIGSVGGRDDNTVENVFISDCTIADSDNGVRIKTVYDATGSVKNVTYSSITLSGINKYGIVIEQDYENGSPTGTPTDGVPITDLTLSDITGSVGDDAAPYYILCAACPDWTVSGVDVTGGTAFDECEGEPSGVSLC